MVQAGLDSYSVCFQSLCPKPRCYICFLSLNINVVCMNVLRLFSFTSWRNIILACLISPPCRVNTVGHRIISCTLRLAWCLYTVSILSVFWWLDKLLNLRMIVSQQLKFGFFFFESLNQSLISPVIKYSVYFIVLGEMFHISLMSTDLWMDLQRCLNYWLGDKPWLANNDLKTARTFPLVIGHLERAYETSKKIVGV